MSELITLEIATAGKVVVNKNNLEIVKQKFNEHFNQEITINNTDDISTAMENMEKCKQLETALLEVKFNILSEELQLLTTDIDTFSKHVSKVRLSIDKKIKHFKQNDNTKIVNECIQSFCTCAEYLQIKNSDPELLYNVNLVDIFTKATKGKRTEKSKIDSITKAGNNLLSELQAKSNEARIKQLEQEAKVMEKAQKTAIETVLEVKAKSEPIQEPVIEDKPQPEPEPEPDQTDLESFFNEITSETEHTSIDDIIEVTKKYYTDIVDLSNNIDKNDAYLLNKVSKLKTATEKLIKFVGQ